MSTKQTINKTKPQALVIADVSHAKHSIKNFYIRDTCVDKHFIKKVLKGLSDTYIDDKHQLELISSFESNAIECMAKYFIFYSIHSALTTYTGKNTESKRFIDHIKKETGFEISINIKHTLIEVNSNPTQTSIKCFNHDFPIMFNCFHVHNKKTKMNDTVSLRGWFGSELVRLAKSIGEIEPGMQALPEVIRLRIKEREDIAKRKILFESSMKKKIPFLADDAGRIYLSDDAGQIYLYL